MSLVGSLEDLGLGDILQIVALSRKSGLLQLHSDRGDGRIVLCDGMVRGAAIKGESDSLRALLVDGGFVQSGDYDRAAERAGEDGRPLEQALAEAGGLAPERLDSLRREHVEQAVMRMFGWRAGEFSFEVRDEVEAQDAELLMPTGINTQYLAMEATRLRDEGGRLTQTDGAGEDETDEPVFSGEWEEVQAPAAEVEPAAVDALALATARGADETPTTEHRAFDPGTESPNGAAEIEVESPPSEPGLVEVAVSASSAPSAASTAAQTTPAPAHLVVIDPDLCALEWVKAALEDSYERVHIFQRSEIGLDRIRHYLGRGAVPVVLLSNRAPADPLTGSSDVDQLVRRMRNLAPRMPIAVLCEEGRPEPSRTGDADLVVYRPASPGSDPDFWTTFSDTADRLRDAMRSLRPPSPSPPVTEQGSDAGPESLSRLKAISAQLRDPSSQGEVLSLVLGFAAESFSRVAVFMLRDDVAVGVAQVGLERDGGPGDEDFQVIELVPDRMPELFRTVLEHRSAVWAAPEGEHDGRLAELLGNGPPDQAYAAPIESGGAVAAILYADNRPGDAQPGDTTALEVVLHEAGLALDRAVLERALAGASEGG